MRAASLVSSHQTSEQFCSKAVTGIVRRWSMVGKRFWTTEFQNFQHSFKTRLLHIIAKPNTVSKPIDLKRIFGA